MDRADIDVFFALGSRYSYLAFTQLPRIERETGCHFVLHPISSAELYGLRGVSPFEGPPPSGQYDWGYRRRDAEMWAEHYGVPFVEPQDMPPDHRLMPRACRAAERQGGLAAFSEALFRAVYAEHRAIDPSECAAVAAAIGLDPARLLADIDSREVEDAVSRDAHEAHRRGAFGVPTFFVDDRMYWGNDRLVLLEAYLQRRGARSGR